MLLICQNHAQYFTRFHIPKIKKNTVVMVATICLTLFQYIIKNFTHINIRLSILNVNSFVNHVKKIKWGVHLQYLHSHIVFRLCIVSKHIKFQLYIKFISLSIMISTIFRNSIIIKSMNQFYFCQFISCFSFKINNFR